MVTVARLVPALAVCTLLVSPTLRAATPPAPPAPPAPASAPAPAPVVQAPSFSAPDADLPLAAMGSSASAFKARHPTEFAVTEGRNTDFYMGSIQGLPGFVIYTHDGDRITGRELMVSGSREVMTTVFQALSGEFSIPGALTEQTTECRDAGSKSVGWHLESSTVSKSKREVLSYREDPTNHAIVVASNSPAGVLSGELLNKAYSDLLARRDLTGNAFAQQWLGTKAAYDDVSHSKGLFGCRISRGGSPGNLPLKFDVALTQTGAQVVNGAIDIPTPEQFAGLNFPGFQAVLSGGKVEGLRFAGSVSQAGFNDTLKRTASNLGDPLTLITTSNGAESLTVASFRPSQDARARSVQTILTYRVNAGQSQGTLVFDVH